MIGIGSQVSIEKGQPGLAVVKAFYQTYDYAKLTLVAFYKMLVGEVSPRNIGGPILIAQMAGQQAQEGLGSFLAFLAVLSINLGRPKFVAGAGARRRSPAVFLGRSSDPQAGGDKIS